MLARTGRVDRRYGLIKLDVQGAELDVLRGGARALAAAEVVVMEFGNIGADWNLGAPSFAEKIAFMDAAGFRPWDISDMNYVSAAYKGGRFKGPGRILAGFDMLLVRKGSLLANATQQRLDV